SPAPSPQSPEVTWCSGRGLRAVLPRRDLLQPVATGGERKRCDYISAPVKQCGSCLDGQLIQRSIEPHGADVMPRTQKVAVRVPRFLVCLLRVRQRSGGDPSPHRRALLRRRSCIVDLRLRPAYVNVLDVVEGRRAACGRYGAVPRANDRVGKYR